MSLEQAIKDNTEAVKENTATVRELIAILKEGNALPISAATEKVIETAKKVSPVLEADLSSLEGIAKPTPAAQSKTAAEAAKEDPTLLGGVPEEPKVLDFQKDIVKPFGALCVAKGRDAGAAILKKWGVEKISHIPADKHAELLADIINASN